MRGLRIMVVWPRVRPWETRLARNFQRQAKEPFDYSASRTCLPPLSACQQLACERELRAIVRLASQGKIPDFKVGDQWRFRRRLLKNILGNKNKNIPTTIRMVIRTSNHCAEDERQYFKGY